jgi:ATP-dependent protease ClpP protease subunit/uncharacterized protein YecT (DUF1311 family)
MRPSLILTVHNTPRVNRSLQRPGMGTRTAADTHGDAGRLERVIPLAGRDEYGNIPLYLNSPGGSVDAALEIVEVMDREEFSTLVASGAQCASACASVVYVSGRYHMVMGTGLLGIHTCYTVKDDNSEPEPSSFCNERIAQKAADHGTSYGAIQMWQRTTGPDQKSWIGPEVACKYGLCGPPGFDDTRAVPSFDCKAATHRSELTICSDKRLARNEASLSKYYSQTIKAMPPSEKDAFRAEQRAWLMYRNGCEADKACLLHRMNGRWNEVMEKWGKYALRTNSAQ